MFKTKGKVLFKNVDPHVVRCELLDFGGVRGKMIDLPLKALGMDVSDFDPNVFEVTGDYEMSLKVTKRSAKDIDKLAKKPLSEK